MEILHRQGEIIRNRYQVVTTIGTGGMATTYAAVDLSNSQRVALKVLSLEHTDDWKTIELFEREAKVLANLHHPFIPRYLDYFELDYAGDNAPAYPSDRRFYLVQELVEGESLAALVARSWQLDEADVKDIAKQILDILVYLHSLSPPVIHRDIKPQNIIRDSHGKIYLVDFGAVQAVYRNTISVGGTFVGTLGYMSPEQLRGRVVTASDLYSLGCSLVFLLTGKLPTDLPQKRMKLDFRDQTDISTHFADWLEKLIEPAVSDRFPDTVTALTTLNAKSVQTLSKAKQSAIADRIGNRIAIHRQDEGQIQITVTENNAGCLTYFCLFFGITWSFTALKWLIQVGGTIPMLLGLVSLTMVSKAIIDLRYIAAKKTILKIDPQGFYLQWTRFSLRHGFMLEEIKGLTSDIDWVNVNIDKQQSRKTPIVNTCAISEGDRQHKFGLGYNLSLNEAQNITQEVSAFLKQLRN